MNELAILLSKILFGWLGMQIFLTLLFALSLNSQRKSSIQDESLPKTAIILCLRGADPFLPKCIHALLNQNYPDYDLKIIIDSKDDPAWKVAYDTIQEANAANVQIRPLEKIRYNCSLKCSSLVQAISELDDSYKVIALVDADTIVHSDWLRTLVTPLADPQIGATTGNRWYLPSGKYWGSTVRYLWNLSAAVQMYLYQIPWGGTFAIKTEVLHQTGLLQKWGQALSEDTQSCDILKKHKLKVKFVPSLMMVNREDCDLSSFFGWVKRQMFLARLYHHSWWSIVADTCFSAIFPNTFLVLFLVSIWKAQWLAASTFISAYVVYTFALLLLVVAVEKRVQQVVIHQGYPPTKLSLSTALKILVTIPVSQLVCGVALFSTFWISTVKWRGVNYRVLSPWNIQMIEYRPYQILDQPTDNKVSL
ncbi:MAG TPA: glycosyltransferase family 2 protein [Nostocaceae cyanobacterium]|nr:glycosyltransferase family 2 protein [Nostocaceae cyanobacterium]